jgi:hypothetical protein
MAIESSVMEDIVRMRELSELLDLQEEYDQEIQKPLLERSGLSILVWLSSINPVRRRLDTLKEESDRRAKRNHQAWLDLQRFIAELKAISPFIDSLSFCKFKQLVILYTRIRYPNFVAVIQPKLHSINTIEA